MESQCKGDCIKYQDELWHWKNRAVVAEKKLLEMEQEAEEAEKEFVLIKEKLEQYLSKLKGE